MPTKPKRKYSSENQLGKDLCQTPLYALAPLLPYIQDYNCVWEPASGENYLVYALHQAGKQVIYSDIQNGTEWDYFKIKPPENVQIQITSPPFSKKYAWIKRALQFDMPFAILVPTDIICAGKHFQPLHQQFNLQQLVPDKRIAFKMLSSGWDSHPQTHTSWLCYRLNLPYQLTFCKLDI